MVQSFKNQVLIIIIHSFKKYNHIEICFNCKKKFQEFLNCSIHGNLDLSMYRKSVLHKYKAIISRQSCVQGSKSYEYRHPNSHVSVVHNLNERKCDFFFFF